VVRGAEGPRHEIRVAELVALLLADVLEADRESLQPGNALPGQQPGDQARVEAAGQQHADGYVAGQAAPHRRAHCVQDGLFPVRAGLRIIGPGPEAQRPEALLPDGAVGLDPQPASRR
jgi:hypothetical protein